MYATFPRFCPWFFFPLRTPYTSVYEWNCAAIKKYHYKRPRKDTEVSNILVEIVRCKMLHVQNEYVLLFLRRHSGHMIQR